jgi:hypothetical protein
MFDEHEERFGLIVRDYLEHPAGDYAELFHCGRVTSPEGVDPEACEEIRRQARQDRIRVITRRAGSGRAFAMLNPQVSDELALELMQDALARGLELQELQTRPANSATSRPAGFAATRSTSRRAHDARRASTPASEPKPSRTARR